MHDVVDGAGCGFDHELWACQRVERLDECVDTEPTGERVADSESHAESDPSIVLREATGKVTSARPQGVDLSVEAPGERKRPEGRVVTAAQPPSRRPKSGGRARAVGNLLDEPSLAMGGGASSGGPATTDAIAVPGRGSTSEVPRKGSASGGAGGGGGITRATGGVVVAPGGETRLGRRRIARTTATARVRAEQDPASSSRSPPAVPGMAILTCHRPSSLCVTRTRADRRPGGRAPAVGCTLSPTMFRTRRRAVSRPGQASGATHSRSSGASLGPSSAAAVCANAPSARSRAAEAHGRVRRTAASYAVSAERGNGRDAVRRAICRRWPGASPLYRARHPALC